MTTTVTTSEKAKITIQPDGKVDISTAGDITIHSDSNVSVNSDQGVTIKAGSLDVFNSLSENGVPVPLRLQAACAGISLDNVLSKKEIQENVERYTKAIQEYRDKTIDDLPLAKNFFDYFTNKEFSNTTLFPRLLEIGLHYNLEICPDCTNPNYKVSVNSSKEEMLRHLVLLEHGKCPKCNQTKSDFVNQGKVEPFTELVLVLGQRSGKTAFTNALVEYLLHQLVKLKDLPVSYGLGHSDSFLQGTFVGPSKAMSTLNNFCTFIDSIKQSKWFERANKTLTNSIHKHEFTCGKHIAIYPKSPKQDKLRGITGIFTIFDECLWLNSKQSNEDVLELYKTIRNTMLETSHGYRKALQNGNSSVPAPLTCFVSSPQKQDEIYSTLLTPKKGKLIYHLPTWEVNPHVCINDLKDEPRFDRDYAAFCGGFVNE